jgi:hypothetical protein
MALIDPDLHSGRSIYTSNDTLVVVAICIGLVLLAMLAAGAF